MAREGAGARSAAMNGKGQVNAGEGWCGEAIHKAQTAAEIPQQAGHTTGSQATRITNYGHRSLRVMSQMSLQVTVSTPPTFLTFLYQSRYVYIV